LFIEHCDPPRISPRCTAAQLLEGISREPAEPARNLGGRTIPVEDRVNCKNRASRDLARHNAHANHQRRLPGTPVEWSIGEASGALAAFALARQVPPRAVRADAALLADFQRTLGGLGVMLEWPMYEALTATRRTGYRPPSR
jgi:hypothetical protein